MINTLDIREIRRKLYHFEYAFRSARDVKRDASDFVNGFLSCFRLDSREEFFFKPQMKTLLSVDDVMEFYIPNKFKIVITQPHFLMDEVFSQYMIDAIRLSEDDTPYVVVSNFTNFCLYHVDTGLTLQCGLDELSNNAESFIFIAQNELLSVENIFSSKAASAIQNLRNSFQERDFSGNDLDVFLTRLMFCLFADDTGFWDDKQVFDRYLKSSKEDGSDLRDKFNLLFDVLGGLSEKRISLPEQFLKADFANIELFKESSTIPMFDADLRRQLLLCNQDIDWSYVSPMIFDSASQLTNKVGEKSSHEPFTGCYQNEKKVLEQINRLFLNELWSEFEKANRINSKNRKARLLKSLHDKMTGLKFLASDFGGGHFLVLVVAYRELRRLENRIIQVLRPNVGGQQSLDVCSQISGAQFYAATNNDSSMNTTRLAMYVADLQMNHKARNELGYMRSDIPLIKLDCNFGHSIVSSRL